MFEEICSIIKDTNTAALEKALDTARALVDQCIESMKTAAADETIKVITGSVTNDSKQVVQLAHDLLVKDAIEGIIAVSRPTFSKQSGRYYVVVAIHRNAVLYGIQD